MKCPECGTSLAMGERMDVQIDYCPKCRGIWLEKGKLEKLIDKSAQPNKNGKKDRQDDDDDDEGGARGFLGGLFGGD
jgi:Zn-finger nucleic acid-binding protein